MWTSISVIMALVCLICALYYLAEGKLGLTISCLVCFVLNILLIYGVDLMNHKWIVFSTSILEIVAVFSSGDIEENNTK